jgi:Pentapeptide repeats (8 copies)
LTSRNQELTIRTQELTVQGQLTDLYISAVDQLGSDKLDVRIGGIYALERVANDSVRDHPTVMEILTAFVRVHSHEQWPPADHSRVAWITRRGRFPARGREQERLTRPDVQAAVAVIGRRDAQRDIRVIDLADSILRRADLTRARLRNADLIHVDLTGANLAYANLAEARLIGANLAYANLDGADLAGANLDGVDLAYANLDGARLAGANLPTRTSAPRASPARISTARTSPGWTSPARTSPASDGQKKYKPREAGWSGAPERITGPRRRRDCPGRLAGWAMSRAATLVSWPPRQMT